MAAPPCLHSSSVATASPAQPCPSCVQQDSSKQLFSALGSPGVLVSSIFSFLQKSVNELWVDFGADMDRDAHQASGRSEILIYV